MNRLWTVAVVLILSTTASCVKIAQAPAPPRVQVAAASNALAQTLATTVATLKIAHTNGQVSAPVLADAFKVANKIAVTGKKIDAELRTAETWGQQRVKVISYIAEASVPALIAALPENVRQIFAAVLEAWNQVVREVIT